jgi:hypothetical protein
MSTNLDNIVRPIDNILDGSNNMLWSQNMEFFLEGENCGVMLVEKLLHPHKEKVNWLTNLLVDLMIGIVQIIGLFLGLSTLQFLPFTVCFQSLEMQRLLGSFWRNDTIALMMPH